MKRIVSLFLALCAAAALLCPSAQAAQSKAGYIAANHTKSNGTPYYIMVNRAQSTVTVYELDEEGYYTVPVKAMICSTGRKGHATPTGTFTIGGRWTWLHMIDGSYGQYATQIKGNILFHSVCYTKKDPSALMTEEYNGLGAPASLGCVRLQTADAKWIYDNCPRGTKVTVYDEADDPGPLGKPDRLVDHISEEEANGWDPTDPREENPWHEILSEPEEPEESAEPGPGPEDPAEEEPAPLPADQAVSYAAMAQALYKLSGEGGPTNDSTAVRWAVNRRLLDGAAAQDFDPAAPMTRQALVSMLYRYETEYRGRHVQELGSLTRFSDGASVHTSAREAMRWAVGAGLIQGTSESTLQPAGYASRAQLDIILRRYSQL